jgi:hypothetical protein
MEIHEPYNPLHKKNLGYSVAEALLVKDIKPLSLGKAFDGAGVYAIYYKGDFPLYRPLAERNQHGKFTCPIYVGKAVPAGARKGGFGLGAPAGRALSARLKQHAKSIEDAENLALADFFCRYLTVDDIWIPLGESLLIDMFSPLWNQVIDGYGNHATGKGRYEQQISPWDVLHPGRPWAAKLKAGKERVTLEKEVKAFFASDKFKNSAS